MTIGTVVVVNDRMQTGYRYTLEAAAGDCRTDGFAPHYTPAEMLAMGVFEGKYCNDCAAEFPAGWFADARLGAKPTPRSTISA